MSIRPIPDGLQNTPAKALLTFSASAMRTFLALNLSSSQNGKRRSSLIGSGEPLASTSKRSNVPILAGGLLLAALIVVVLAMAFWPRPIDDPTRQAAAQIAKDCAGGQDVGNTAKVEAGLSRYITRASGDASVTSRDVGTVTSKLKPDGIGLDIYKAYTQCLKDHTESYLKLKGVPVVADSDVDRKEVSTPAMTIAATPTNRTINVLKGYVYYEEDDGHVTTDGVFEPFPKSDLPRYDHLKPGMVLRSVRAAEIREGPSGDDSPAERPLGARQCVRIIGKPEHPPRTRLTSATSGGRIEVEAIACPARPKTISATPTAIAGRDAVGYPVLAGTALSVNQSGGVTAGEIGNLTIDGAPR
jgi:hypothetical protein